MPLYDRPPSLLARHPLFSGEMPVAIMTHDKPRYRPKKEGEKHFESDLKYLGVKFERTRGHYDTDENLYIIYGLSKRDAIHLAREYGQESLIHSENGKPLLIYAMGERAGQEHQALPGVEWSPDKPLDNNWTLLPRYGYISLRFNVRFDKNMKKSEKIGGLDWLKSKNQKYSRTTGSHAHAYPWHDGHTGHYSSLRKNNEQFAPKGTSKSYHRFAEAYGEISSSPTNLKIYPYQNKNKAVKELVSKYGYQSYYAGGKHGRPDLANRNYNTGHLMIYDPTPDSGGDFKDREYTDTWRHIHELAHALTYKQLNQKYGEGRRIGGLGMRTPHEAKRSVEWEWLAAHKQRELSSQIGVHISDEDFARELNTVMHDAVHRAVTGKFSDPGEEGFNPHSKIVPLQHALDIVDAEARKMGIQKNSKNQKDRPSYGVKWLRNLRKCHLSKMAKGDVIQFPGNPSPVKDRGVPASVRRLIPRGLPMDTPYATDHSSLLPEDLHDSGYRLVVHHRPNSPLRAELHAPAPQQRWPWSVVATMTFHRDTNTISHVGDEHPGVRSALKVALAQYAQKTGRKNQ